MTRFLLDSSTINDILSGNARGAKAARRIEGGELATSVICYCEVLNNINLDKQPRAEAFISKLLVFGLSVADGKIALDLQDSCRAAGRQVPAIDCLIAATAIANSAIVVSSDLDFARIEGVEKLVF